MIVPKKLETAEDIQEWMVKKLAELLAVEPDTIDVQQPLESYGLDSSRAMVLVTQAEKMLGVEVSPVLLWHYPTIEALAQRLAEDCEENTSEVQDTNAASKSSPTLNLQAEAVLDPRIYPASSYFAFTSTPDNVFLTGATGFLGAFIIYELLKQTNADVYCLVRAANLHAGKNKVKNNLEKYGIWEDSFESRIIPILGDLSQPLLGISQEAFEMLAANMDAVYHSAATLNYVYPYSALKAANVLGTQEVLRLASMIKVKPMHYVSSVAVFESPAYAGKVVKEDDDFNHWEGIFLGYSQTKWVAEKLVKIAGERGLPITIHRPPLISGHSETGVGNTDDFINLMVKGCLQIGTFPDVDYMMDMSPVDYVSKSIVHLSLQKESLGKAFNLQHPQPVPLKELVNWVSKFGFAVEVIPYEEWQNQLVNISSPDNPLYTLRPFLLERWSKEQITIPDLYLKAKRPFISCDATLKALAGSNIVCPPIDSKLFMVYSAFLIESGFIQMS
ncbi:thioester reductase domain-containing protein [Calothrix sp. UHCC 0171]|uniref:thioester reductase domain-containing protein n=1 Tax=Calothrix sp. UHCC 0171 TaxID=3110245 RepID=UPI002B210591|nr:thioester reductase domain-containing protein [Calothrix sp. UHCC 0171]MEA5572937.1 thioester reductase domain-containing protein [Calothrix sp. UHCC 0171]